jgi:hypothetical protein
LFVPQLVQLPVVQVGVHDEPQTPLEQEKLQEETNVSLVQF